MRVPHLFVLLLAAPACAPSDNAPADTDPVATACLDAERLQTPDGVLSCIDQGQWCDEAQAACVDPWRLDSPAFATCEPSARDQGASLAAKAATYQERADRLHVHPDLGWMMGVRLPASADPATATWQDVQAWQSGENDGLWSSLYLASQAFRYASTTGEERDAALATVRLMLAAERDRMDISGVKGNFVRQYVKPGIDGLSCPEQDERYRADVEKDDNRWVKIDEDGCITHLPTDGDAWITSETCPGSRFSGWCFLDNTSKDEYAGHMFALGAVLKLVDDEPSRELAAGMVSDVVTTLLDHDLTMFDPDGRPTEHGDFSPALGLGFNAAFSLAFFTIAEKSLDDARIAHAKRCFTGEAIDDCPTFQPSVDMPFTDSLDYNAVHIDPDGCLSNDNNASMFLLAMADLLWWETDPDLRARYHEVLANIWLSDNRRALGKRENAWYDVFWAAFKDLGPDSDGPAFDAVTEATCGLSWFPVDEVRRAVPPSDTPQLCLDRLDRPMGATPRGPDERCMKTFLWWNDQYVLAGCDADPTRVEAPADYLLPYWMGRYFGFWGDDT